MPKNLLLPLALIVLLLFSGCDKEHNEPELPPKVPTTADLLKGSWEYKSYDINYYYQGRWMGNRKSTMSGKFISFYETEYVLSDEPKVRRPYRIYTNANGQEFLDLGEMEEPTTYEIKSLASKGMTWEIIIEHEFDVEVQSVKFEKLH